MYSWFAPFAVVLVDILLYFTGSAAKQAAFKRDINFYMICVVVTAAVSIIANARYGKDWTDYVAWALAIISIAAAIWGFKNAAPVEQSIVTPNDRGPLESADKGRGL